ncbi:MAG: MFS transporter [Gordonibacter sp.]
MDVDVSKGSWQSRTTTRRPNTVTALVALTAFLLFGLNNTEMAALPTYTMSLGAGPFVASLQNSLFVLVAVLLRIPLERIVAQQGSRWAMVVGAIGYTTPCLLLVGSIELWQIIALRLLQAFGLALFQPSVAQYLAVTSPTASLGRRLGIVRFATTASLMVGPVTLFPLITAQGYPAFFCTLALVGACGTVVALALPHKQAGPLAHREHCTKTTPLPRRQFALLLASPLMLALGYSVVMNFGQTLADQVLASCSDGLLFACVSTGGLIGSLAAGWAADKFGPKRSVTCTIAFNGTGLLCMALGHSVAPVLAGAFLCGTGYFGAIATLVTAAGISPGRNTSTLLARQQSALDMGMILGGLLAGALVQVGLPVSAAFLATSAVAGMSLFAWGMMYPSTRENH